MSKPNFVYILEEIGEFITDHIVGIILVTVFIICTFVAMVAFATVIDQDAKAYEKCRLTKPIDVCLVNS